MIEQTCGFTGHRDIPADKVDFVKQELRAEIMKAINDGFTHFISGFADGSDLYFSAIVAELKAENPALQLEAAIPYRKRLVKLMDNEETRALVLACNIIGVHSEDYSQDCFMKRNRFIVAHAGRIIAVYDGRDKGGTLSTMRFAHVHEREIREIRIDKAE